MTATLTDCVDAFESALATDPAADPAAFLPAAGHPDHAAVLAELLRVDLERAWTRGDRRRLSDYRPRFPGLAGDALQAVAFEEFRLRRLYGEPADPDEYARLGVSVADWEGLAADSGVWGQDTSVVSQSGLIDSTTPPPVSHLFASLAGPPGDDPTSVSAWLNTGSTLPQAGSEFLGYHLDEELGRGAFGRVYLAREDRLAGRPVALKVAANIAGESRTLAQLQHTHIVPIYSFHQLGDLQAVVMPYYGRTTLARVIERVGGRPNLPSSGRELLSTLDVRAEATVVDRGSTPELVPPVAAGSVPTDGWANLDRLSYVGAVLTLGAELADGLAHAHARGILHRDLKPANVLLTDEGRPMLLDFNLAEDTKLRGTAERAQMGGTLPYMSPEQLRAFARPADPLDGRTDVYSLGVVLFELLTGRHPYPDRRGPTKEVVETLLTDRLGRPPSVRAVNPDVSPAAEAIIHKCLAFNPQFRYATADQLRDDLRRQLDHKPLKHAAEPSRRERLRKWAHRHPKLSSGTVVATAAGLLLALTAGGAVAARERSRDLHAQGLLGEHQTAFRDARLAALHPDHSRPRLDALAGTLKDVLDRYAAAGNWQTSPDVRYLTTADRDRLRGDLGEVHYLLARTAVRQARGSDRDTHLSRADRLLTTADTLAGDRLPRALKQLHADLLAARGDTAATAEQAAADATPAETGRDRFYAAARLFERGQTRPALDHLRAATQLDPHDLSAWYLCGAVHAEAGQHDLAAACFGTCTALKPDHAPAWLNRGVQYTRTGRFALALANFDTALRLDPTRGGAYLERAVAHQQQQHPTEAGADFDRACASDDAGPLAFFRRAHFRRTQGDHAGAVADVAEGFRREPREAVDWVARSENRLDQADALAAAGGGAFARPIADAALADVRQALALDPDHADALQQTAHLQSEWLGREPEAVAALDQLVAAKPQSANALAGRAVLLARAGDRDGAMRDARDALLAEPTAPTMYQVAGVFARFAPERADDKREALSLLWAALKTGYGLDLVDGDSDLDPIRADAEFKRVVAKAKAVRAELAR